MGYNGKAKATLGWWDQVQRHNGKRGNPAGRLRNIGSSLTILTSTFARREWRPLAFMRSRVEQVREGSKEI
jgi:hypothetical protein